MTDIPEVLVGIAIEPDGEILEGSRTAVEHGAALARALGAPLAILHSTWTSEHDAEHGPEPTDALRTNVAQLAAEVGFPQADEQRHFAVGVAGRAGQLDALDDRCAGQFGLLLAVGS